MLNRVETRIMDFLFTKCRNKGTGLVLPDEINKSLLPKYEITSKQLESHMKNIMLDGYVNYTRSDDGGNLVYVVTLTTRGEAFRREQRERVVKRWQSIGWKILLTVIGVVVGFALTKILGL